MSEAIEPFRLSIALAATGGTCLWAENERAKTAFGYSVPVESLPITDALKARIHAVVRRYEIMAEGDLGDPEMPFGPYLYGFEAEAAGFVVEVLEIAARLKNELGPDFVIEHSFEEPLALIVGWNRNWTGAAAIASVGLAVLTFWFAQALLFTEFGGFAPFGRILLGIMFGAFGLLFAGTAVTYALACFDAGPVLVIDRFGIFDRRLSRAPVPWAWISSLTPRRRSAHLMLILNLSGSERPPLPSNPVWVANRLGARLTGAPEFAVKTIGLRGDMAQILAAARIHGRFDPP